MIDVNSEIRRLLRTDSVKKNLHIVFRNGESDPIDNDKIVIDSPKYTESICSRNDLKFGLCEQSSFEFEAHDVPDVKDAIIDVELQVDTSSIRQYKENVSTIYSTNENFNKTEFTYEKIHEPVDKIRVVSPGWMDLGMKQNGYVIVNPSKNIYKLSDDLDGTLQSAEIKRKHGDIFVDAQDVKSTFFITRMTEYFKYDPVSRGPAYDADGGPFDNTDSRKLYNEDWLNSQYHWNYATYNIHRVNLLNLSDAITSLHSFGLPTDIDNAYVVTYNGIKSLSKYYQQIKWRTFMIYVGSDYSKDIPDKNDTTKFCYIIKVDYGIEDPFPNRYGGTSRTQFWDSKYPKYNFVHTRDERYVVNLKFTFLGDIHHRYDDIDMERLRDIIIYPTVELYPQKCTLVSSYNKYMHSNVNNYQFIADLPGSSKDMSFYDDIIDDGVTTTTTKIITDPTPEKIFNFLKTIGVKELVGTYPYYKGSVFVKHVDSSFISRVDYKTYDSSIDDNIRVEAKINYIGFLDKTSKAYKDYEKYGMTIFITEESVENARLAWRPDLILKKHIIGAKISDNLEYEYYPFPYGRFRVTECPLDPSKNSRTFRCVTDPIISEKINDFEKEKLEYEVKQTHVSYRPNLACLLLSNSKIEADALAEDKETSYTPTSTHAIIENGSYNITETQSLFYIFNKNNFKTIACSNITDNIKKIKYRPVIFNAHLKKDNVDLGDQEIALAAFSFSIKLYGQTFEFTENHEIFERDNILKAEYDETDLPDQIFDYFYNDEVDDSTDDFNYWFKEIVDDTFLSHFSGTNDDYWFNDYSYSYVRKLIFMAIRYSITKSDPTLKTLTKGQIMPWLHIKAKKPVNAKVKDYILNSKNIYLLMSYIINTNQTISYPNNIINAKIEIPFHAEFRIKRLGFTYRKADGTFRTFSKYNPKPSGITDLIFKEWYSNNNGNDIELKKYTVPTDNCYYYKFRMDDLWDEDEGVMKDIDYDMDKFANSYLEYLAMFGYWNRSTSSYGIKSIDIEHWLYNIASGKDRLGPTGLYPDNALLPANDLYPDNPAHSFMKSEYRTITYDEEPKVQYNRIKYSYVVIEKGDDGKDQETKKEGYYPSYVDRDYTEDEENNEFFMNGTYDATDNVLFDHQLKADAEKIAIKMLYRLNGLSYRPFNMDTMGLPYLEPGDSIGINTDNRTTNMIVLRRTLSGVQTLVDHLEAT